MKIREAPRPLYIRAEEALAELIGDRYQPGDRLPPEPNLARQLGISRSALHKALRSVEEQTLITRCQGAGAFVNVLVRSSDAAWNPWSVVSHSSKDVQFPAPELHRGCRARRRLKARLV
jgi:DNA-binding FadR family transcriptional regulator